MGVAALQGNNGDGNTAVGANALQSNTTGSFNTANGSSALSANTEGNGNTANGSGALERNTTGGGNTAFGGLALSGNIGGDANVAIGNSVLEGNTTGFGNTAVGVLALIDSNGNKNVALGYDAGHAVTTASNVICIGADMGGVNVSNICLIGNIRGVQTQNANAIPVLIDSAGQLGTQGSSRRFKHEIRPMDKTSEAILGLKPVTFHYKSDTTNTAQFGLIAEEVAEINPDLVVRDGSGEIYTVRYDAVNAMLLNEFLKEHAKVEQLRKNFESKTADQQKQIEALTAGLQKVSAQLELSKSAPQTVLNNR
jgi:hypothetical protein